MGSIALSAKGPQQRWLSQLIPLGVLMQSVEEAAPSIHSGLDI